MRRIRPRLHRGETVRQAFSRSRTGVSPVWDLSGFAKTGETPVLPISKYVLPRWRRQRDGFHVEDLMNQICVRREPLRLREFAWNGRH